MIISAVDVDIKQAMLGGDKLLASTLRNLKSAVLYEQVAQNKRSEAASDELVVSVFSKESKKRGDAIKLYESAGDKERAAHEQYELGIIAKYLPKQATEQEIRDAIDQVFKDGAIDRTNPKAIGQTIAAVKQKLSPMLVDGGLLARLAKELLA